MAFTFSTEMRAKLHKRVKYADELKTINWVAEARQVVKEVNRGTRSPEDDDGMSYDEACSLLDAFQAATSATK